MHFTFITTSAERLPNLRIIKDETDNLATLNIGVTTSNAYFTCGDLVFNYNKESGEVVSIDGYLPYFEKLPINEDLALPSQSKPARLYVADLTKEPIFAIENLPLEVSGDKRIIHAGENTSTQIIGMSESVYIGLNDGAISDVYLYLGIL